MDTQKRRCRRCGLEKPISEFPAKPDKKWRYYHLTCRECATVARNVFFDKEVAIWHEASEKGELHLHNRRCSTCKREKTLLEFSPREHRCRSCTRIRARKRIRTTGRYALARGIAKRRLLAFELTREQFAAYVAQPCSYCNAPVSETGMGLDRIDSKVGYEVGNVVPCCGVCNMVKSDMFSYDEMIEIGAVIKRIREKRTQDGEEPLQSHVQIRNRRFPDDDAHDEIPQEDN